ncbi:MAG: hypothetical protein ACRDM1_16740 [Gaiellaceae bacterium]
MGPSTGTGARYDAAMGELWHGLARTLARLDVAAAEPESLDGDEAVTALRRLQYALHLASESAYGLEPPAGSESAHAELAEALSCARDATAEVAEAVEVWGADGVEPLLHEWRGALFRVRLARMRLVPSPPHAAETPEPAGGFALPLAAFLLALLGAVAFVGGATLGLWPLWTAGLLAVAASVLVYRDG